MREPHDGPRWEHSSAAPCSQQTAGHTASSISASCIYDQIAACLRSYGNGNQEIPHNAKKKRQPVNMRLTVMKQLSNKASHINGKLCRQFVSLVNLNQSRHESKCRDSNEQATSEQATGKQARQPVNRQGNRQPVNRQGNRCSGKR